jgi:serine/threonine-protein kinase
MGAVYCAHHTGIDRRVAFKILQPNIAVSDEHIAELFEREAKVAGRLSHENIVDVKDAGRTPDGLSYIVMEWLEGPTLEEELKETGRFSFTRAAGILRQVAEALEEAHSKHVVHRDLKPANIMLVQRGQGRGEGSEQIKVLDFGIGKVIGETGASVSAVMGTPNYASPEQLQLGRHIDTRSDIYSLGVILYRTLSGRLPFAGASAEQLIQQHLSAAPAPLVSLRPDTPAEIDRIVAGMLAKDPAARPQSAREVSKAFDRALADADTLSLETRLLAETPPSGETTIDRARAMIAATTESMSGAERQGNPETEAGLDVQTTRPFTHKAPAQKPRRAGSRPVLVSLIGLAVTASGYGLYRFAANSMQSGEAELAMQASQPTPTLDPSPAESPSPTAAPGPKPQSEMTAKKEAAKDKPRGVQPPPAGGREEPGPAPPSAASRMMAERHFLQARELYKQRDYKAALVKTNEALRLDPQHRRAQILKRNIQKIIKILGEQ